jgi:hypothetical protein
MEATLRYQLENFYEVNGYGAEGGINSDWIWLKFKYFSLPIPNVKGRRENVWRHDMLHILLDYPTTWRGEGQVAGWVLGSGGWGKFYVAWLFCFSTFGVGFVFFPKSTFDAFVRGRNTLSPYLLGIEKEKLFQANIDDLKHDFGFNKSGFRANLKDKLLFIGWILLTIVWYYLLIIISLITLFKALM